MADELLSAILLILDLDLNCEFHSITGELISDTLKHRLYDIMKVPAYRFFSGAGEYGIQHR